MDTETVFTAAFYQLSEKNNFVIYFFDRNIIVSDSFVGLLHVVKLMVVSCKECFGMSSRMFVNMLYDCPCDRYSVIGTCPSSQFIEKYQTAVRYIIQNISGFVHFYHECRFS